VHEDNRALVLARLVAGKLTAEDAALLLGISPRQLWRLRRRFVGSGPGSLAHRNRGKVPANRLDPDLVARVVALRRERYDGLNDSHFADLLREREGIALSRASVQRILRGAGIATPRRHRVARYRARRERRAAEGMLVQLDGSREDWLGTGERSSLHVAIDDATGTVLAGVFRAQEDAAGYLEVLRQMLTAKGVPLAVYTDRHGIFVRAPERETLAEELAGGREPTQLGRAFAELGIELILARSPQAKGRVERLFGTLQDRLGAELSLAGIRTIAAANAFLPAYLARHNARFQIAPRDAIAAWRALPAARSIESVCCFKYLRVVAHDNTLRLGALRLQLPPRGRHWTWAGQRLEARQYLDGAWSVLDPDGRELVRTAPMTSDPLRAQGYVRARIPGVPPLPARPGADHPWRKKNALGGWHPAAARRTLTAARLKGRAV